jgi:hypothetical protein
LVKPKQYVSQLPRRRIVANFVWCAAFCKSNVWLRVVRVARSEDEQKMTGLRPSISIRGDGGAACDRYAVRLIGKWFAHGTGFALGDF